MQHIHTRRLLIGFRIYGYQLAVGNKYAANEFEYSPQGLSLEFDGSTSHGAESLILISGPPFSPLHSIPSAYHNNRKKETFL